MYDVTTLLRGNSSAMFLLICQLPEEHKCNEWNNVSKLPLHLHCECCKQLKPSCLSALYNSSLPLSPSHFKATLSECILFFITSLCGANWRSLANPFTNLRPFKIYSIFTFAVRGLEKKITRIGFDMKSSLFRLKAKNFFNYTFLLKNTDSHRRPFVKPGRE